MHMHMWFQFARRLVRPRSNMGSGALVETNAHTCRALLLRSEKGSGAERIFRTHQRGRGILWIPDRGVDKATDGRK